ncbi:hypothetical protein ACWEH1_01095 [Micromonospora chersina]
MNEDDQETYYRNERDANDALELYEPGIFIAYKMTVTMIPKIAKSTGASVKCPNFTKVESLLIIIPELCKFTVANRVEKALKTNSSQS